MAEYRCKGSVTVEVAGRDARLMFDATRKDARPKQIVVIVPAKDLLAIAAKIVAKAK